MSRDTIPARLQDTAQQRGTATAYREKFDGAWRPTSWTTYAGQVRQAGNALMALGIEPKDKTAILGFNRPEWSIFHLASMSAGAIPIGIYTTNAPVEVEYVLHHAEARAILVENSMQWEKIRQIYANVPSLTHVVLMRGTEVPDDAPDGLTVLDWETFMAAGQDVDGADLDARIDALEPQMPATFIYTSGTTGPPKAVMLSHRNLFWTTGAMTRLWAIDRDGVMLSYLPLSHIAEQMFSVHGAVNVGYQVDYAESAEKIAENLKEVRPTFIFGVPRVWERFYHGLHARLGEATGIRAKLVAWARGVGTEAVALRNRGEAPGAWLSFKYRVAERLVFHKIKSALGLDRAGVLVSGAAPISSHILEFFATLDLPIWEVYGQSEGSGPSTTNWAGNTRFGTVGQAIPGTEVRLDEEGQVLVRGENVFLGYYKDADATAATLQDGWLHSGDLGEFDSDGYLTITGRKKDIIITSGGKNIAPKNIEAALTRIELVSQAVVIGEGRRFITALLTLNEEALDSELGRRGLDLANANTAPELRAAIQAGVDEVNTQFARVEQVRNFYIIPHNFGVETGELTPTLKLKRQVIIERFAAEIDAMYT